jgi:hypothetical protein
MIDIAATLRRMSLREALPRRFGLLRVRNSNIGGCVAEFFERTDSDFANCMLRAVVVMVVLYVAVMWTIGRAASRSAKRRGGKSDAEFFAGSANPCGKTIHAPLGLLLFARSSPVTDNGCGA